MTDPEGPATLPTELHFRERTRTSDMLVFMYVYAVSSQICWSLVQDLNLRPFAPKANALPGCANERISVYIYSFD